ncbi:MAG: leucine-rich repeat domain-containing protein [Bacilli bacterium]|nr:leucine-rich repeat domain-containing protein [Bacilli bacterium]
MKTLKFLSLLFLFMLTGCIKPEKFNPEDIDAISQENLQLLFDDIQMDVNYPYGLDFYIKDKLAHLESISYYWFEVTSPIVATVGIKQVTMNVINPEGIENIIKIDINYQEMNIEYDIDDFIFDKKNQSITGFINQVNKLVIPENINGVRVVHIGDGAFQKKGIEDVYIPNTISSIGARAFQHNQLTKLNLPPSVEMVGVRAFSNNNFTSIKLEKRLLAFDDWFIQNNPIEEVVLAEDTTIDNQRLHWKRLGLPLDLLPGIQKIDGIFYSEETHTIYGVEPSFEHHISSSIINPIIETLDVNHINDYAFENESFVGFRIPNNIRSIGKKAYSNSGISDLRIPKSVTFIDDQAFDNCNTEILYLHDGILHFGEQVFANNPINTIGVIGNTLQYNEVWDEIGFPDSLKPNYREPIEPLASWKCSDSVQYIDSLTCDQIVYGIGFSSGNDGDFIHTLDEEVISFLFKYDLTSNTKKTIMLLDPVYQTTSIAMGDDDTLIVSAYTYDDSNILYTPYLLYFDIELNLIEAKAIQADVKIPWKLKVNNEGNIILISESNQQSLDSVLIMTQEGEILYQYKNTSGLAKLSFYNVVVDVNDFILVGSVRSKNYVTAVNGNDKEGYVMRINQDGVVWEKRIEHNYMLNLYRIENLNDGSFLIYGRKNIDIPNDNAPIYIKINGHGDIIDEINLESRLIADVRNMRLFNDTIYVLASVTFDNQITELIQLDLSLNVIKRTTFVQHGIGFSIALETEDQLLFIGDSLDLYLANDTMVFNLVMYLFYLDK